jgi:hypothetical protein
MTAPRTADIVLPSPSRVGQATTAEQARAIAEVMAAVRIAQDYPRDRDRVTAVMLRACGGRDLAEHAFYALKRGEETVSGPSVHLARELALTWGNIQTGLYELIRDDEYAQSEMQVVAWDLESNTRVAHTFIVPHRRDLKGGRVRPLTTMQEIYENNANAGARRLRTAIFAVLPSLYVETAIAACQATLATAPPGNRPLAARVADAVDRFGKLGITPQQLTEHRHRPPADWTEGDLSELLIVYRSIGRREITTAEAFPPARLHVEQSEAGVRRVIRGDPGSSGGRQGDRAVEAVPADAPPPDTQAEPEDWPATAQPPAEES